MKQTLTGLPLPTHRYSWRRLAWRSYVQVLKRTNWPILVGPWHGEVGFEALYWIPFLERLIQHGIARERLIPISRGGAACWYGTPTGLELYAMRTIEQVRRENRLQSVRYGYQKQLRVTRFDQAVLKDAAHTMGLGQRYHVIHPAWMYHLLAPYWTGLRGYQWLSERTRYPLIPPPPLPDGLVLPQPFIAVRFYARSTWPHGHKLVQQATAAIVQHLAQSHAVVVLENPMATDEHLDFKFGNLPAHVQRLTDLWPSQAETNLAVQSAVLARAVGFVGTYGGVAQLALRLGKPAMSFVLEWSHTAPAHKTLSDLLAVHGQLPFHVFGAAELPLLHLVLPPAFITAPLDGAGTDGVHSAVPSQTPPPGDSSGVVVPTGLRSQPVGAGTR